jgi:hypothetical protein
VWESCGVLVPLVGGQLPSDDPADRADESLRIKLRDEQAGLGIGHTHGYGQPFTVGQKRDVGGVTTDLTDQRPRVDPPDRRPGVALRNAWRRQVLTVRAEARRR